MIIIYIIKSVCVTLLIHCVPGTAAVEARTTSRGVSVIGSGAACLRKIAKFAGQPGQIQAMIRRRLLHPSQPFFNITQGNQANPPMTQSKQMFHHQASPHLIVTAQIIAIGVGAEDDKRNIQVGHEFHNGRNVGVPVNNSAIEIATR